MAFLGASMSTIFDEVDDILNDKDPEISTEEVSDSSEMNFNEEELQDIMAEIEGLEKEFDTETVEEPVLEPIELAFVEKQNDFQSEIDAELAMSMNSIEAEAPSTPSPIAEAVAVAEIPEETPKEVSFEAPADEAPSKILSFEKPAPIAPLPTQTIATQGPEISFEAHGQMNLNLGFKIGEETARLTIDPIKGLVVTMAGVVLCINQEDGCNVTMDSGVKFTIPLTTFETTPKKKTA